jgi:hypothetical protein
MLFGTFLVDRGVADLGHIQEAIELQQRGRPSLGQIAVSSGRLTRDAIDETLARLRPGQRIGEALVEQGRMNDSQVRQLLLVQMRDSEPLGSILVRMGVMDDATLDRELIAFYEEKFHRELLH